MKRILSGFTFLLCAVFLLGGCAGKEKKESEYSIYYKNPEGTKLITEPFEAKGKTQSELLDAFLDALAKDYSEDSISVIPDNVELVRYELKDNQLTISFGQEYEEMSKADEVLLRAAVVQTVTQLKSVQYVSFIVGELPLADSSGNPVGLMSAETFVENEMESYQETTLTLYFANETGDKLVETTKKVYYKATTSMERLVVEQLIDGPEEEGAYSTIPASTKIQNVVVEDGICYVNLNDAFLKAENDVTAQVCIYSLVNSLSELTGVNKVQILINGETTKSFRDIISLEDTLERNLDLIESEKRSESGE